ncbi:calcium uptake protein 1, mitochondrial-like [Actinia tenebrosa]|uniref:Calcium uptake protein 1, mitochondrial-like n=1 Tax=Actinia tenebrosa TaxID=6105 RepID=A0A6P8JEW9_ACTTE|nr:calcium uptake protein 1, mitochondrial-like [Actinia tenebrosa]
MFSRCLQCQRSFTNRQNIPRIIYNSGVLKKLPRHLVTTLPENRFSTVVTEENADKKTNNTESEEPGKEEAQKRRARLVSVMIGSAVGFFGSSYVLYNQLTKNKAKAEGATHIEKENIEETKTEDDGEHGEDVLDERKKKKKKGFRARRVIEYENRIRQYSTPDKVFRYFASLKIVHPGEENEVFMTPEDFVRSLTPGKIQPEGHGLDEFEKFDPEKHKYKGYQSNEFDNENSVFMKMGDYGLVSFSDYIFLLTVLSLPPRMYEVAFQMFDLNGDGEVSPEEFEKVQNILFSTTATGSRHRDHSTTGSVLNYTINTGLKVYFFGENGEEKLTGQKFIEFQKKLQSEVMYLEFLSYDPENGRITERQFADMLLTYSNFHEKKKQQILKRVKKAFKDNPEGVTFQNYLNFFHFLRNISEAEVALSFHNAANKAIDPETFKRVARTIAGVTLDDHVIDIVYHMFDENGDGELSNKEFIAVMKNQLVRGLENPKDTGFTKLISAMWKCAKHVTYNMLHPNPKEPSM